jgi:hypothetical protein
MPPQVEIARLRMYHDSDSVHEDLTDLAQGED